MKQKTIRKLIFILFTGTWLPVAMAQVNYPAELPVESKVREALQQLPETQAARSGIDLADAERQRLERGPYEWSLRGELARRQVVNDDRYNEYEVSLERPLRWFGKSEKDTAIGRQKVEVSGAAYADAWHEAARELLTMWFDALRAERAAASLDEQLEVAARMSDEAEKRVKLGSAPKMEALLVKTEYERLRAGVQQAKQRAQLNKIALQKKYPALVLPDTIDLTGLPATIGDDNQMLGRLVEDDHEIKRAQMEVEHARLLAERSALERTPDPTVALRYTSERSHEERIVGLGLSIPIPSGGRRADHAAALAQLDITRQNAEQTRIRVENAAARLVEEVNSNRDIAQTLATVSEQANNNARLVNKAHSLGEASLADALLARRQALEARQAAESAYIDALYAYARLLVDTHRIWASPGENEAYGAENPADDTTMKP